MQPYQIFILIFVIGTWISCSENAKKSSTTETAPLTELELEQTIDNQVETTFSNEEITSSEEVINESPSISSEKKVQGNESVATTIKNDPPKTVAKKVNQNIETVSNAPTKNKIESTPPAESKQKEIEQEVTNSSVKQTTTATTTTQPKTTDTEKKSTLDKVQPKSKPTHEKWNALLQKYVSASGKVNYTGFKSDISKLNAYLEELAANTPDSDWSRSEAMAFWINAYNANTIKMVAENYPTKSIMDLAGGKPFDKKWIKIGDKTYSLNNIENDILRPRYKDARIHFAVNCAAQSCPPIYNRAWTASNLNSTLEKQAKAFINNDKYNTLSKNKVEISKIFEWYAVDFGNITTFLNKYAATEISDKAKVSYKEYDWALNN